MAEPYVVVAVDSRVEPRFRVVAVNQLYPIKPERAVDRPYGRFQTFLRRYEVPRSEGVCGIEADVGGEVVERGEYIGNLIEVAADARPRRQTVFAASARGSGR